MLKRAACLGGFFVSRKGAKAQGMPYCINPVKWGSAAFPGMGYTGCKSLRLGAFARNIAKLPNRRFDTGSTLVRHGPMVAVRWAAVLTGNKKAARGYPKRLINQLSMMPTLQKNFRNRRYCWRWDCSAPPPQAAPGRL